MTAFNIFSFLKRIFFHTFFPKCNPKLKIEKKNHNKYCHQFANLNRVYTCLAYFVLVLVFQGKNYNNINHGYFFTYAAYKHIAPIIKDKESWCTSAAPRAEKWVGFSSLLYCLHHQFLSTSAKVQDCCKQNKQQ